MTPDQLDELFKRSPAGGYPDGEAEGATRGVRTDPTGPVAPG